MEDENDDRLLQVECQTIENTFDIDKAISHQPQCILNAVDLCCFMWHLPLGNCLCGLSVRRSSFLLSQHAKAKFDAVC
jgi:hypothetical protein